MSATGYTAAAVQALTAAARGEHDFADFLADVLARVAANLGSAEALTAGRPGSWEASHVDALVYGTTGGDLTPWQQAQQPQGSTRAALLCAAADAAPAGPPADGVARVIIDTLSAAAAEIDGERGDSQQEDATVTATVYVVLTRDDAERVTDLEVLDAPPLWDLAELGQVAYAANVNGGDAEAWHEGTEPERGW